MELRRKAAALAVIGFLTGCATANYRPIVDLQGRDRNRYELDLQQCQALARQAPNAAEGALAGGAAGAILGSLLAAAAGRGYDRAAHARVGALTGAVGAAAHTANTQRDIVRTCLANRGYSVLH